MDIATLSQWRSAEPRVLLVGTGGMLARAWERLLLQCSVPVVCPTLTELDLTQPETLKQTIVPGIRLVLNCAAWTDVDGAETKEAQALAVNGRGVEHLARRCREIGAMLAHYSTDYVFAGTASTPYRVDEPRAPLNAYGRSKAAGEVALQASGCRHLLIRTSWLYAPWGNNFVRTMTRLARTKPMLKVVNDQHGRPTSAEHLAATTLALIEKQATGTYHVTDGGQCTWYDFAVQIAAAANPQCRVEACTTAQFPRPARRPAYSVLDLSQTEALVGPMPDWRANLDDVIKRMEPVG